jgi:NhaP-type Na+/H+ or K+/H+ antiporter
MGKFEDNYRWYDIRSWEEKDADNMLAQFGNIVTILFTFLFFMFFLGFDLMHPNEHGGAGWALCLIWGFSYFCGKVCEKIGVPALLGMLLSGLLLKNLPGDPVQYFPDAWGTTLRAFGLSLILMRSGLELDVPQLKKQGWVAARLTVLPGVCEAFTVAGANAVIFGMPFALALSGGFVLAAVSPAVVVSGMFDLQSRGYGVAKGIPSLIVAAASFDDVVAISGFSMCIGVAINTGEDPVLGALHGPINVIGGLSLGYLGGHLCGCNRIWNTPGKRSAIMIATGLMFMFAANELHFTGGGAMAGLVTGVFASMAWQSGKMGFLSSGPSAHSHHEVEHTIAKLWNYVAQPILFGVIGVSVNFREIDADIIPLGIAVVLIGAVVRVPIAYFVTQGKDLTPIERAFIGLSWIPKATVQAALGSVPLDIIRETYNEDDPDFEKYERYGNAILVTAVMSILVTAPIGLVAISVLGPRWLDCVDPEVDKVDVEIDVDDDSGSADGGGVTMSEKDGGDKGSELVNIPKRGSSSKIKVVETLKRIDSNVDESWMYFENRRRADNTGENIDIDNLRITRFFSQFQHYLHEADKILMEMDVNDTVAARGKVMEARDNLLQVFAGVAATRIAIESCQPGAFPAHTLFTASEGAFVDKPTRKEIIATLKEHPEEILRLDAKNGVIQLKGVHQSARRVSVDKKRKSSNENNCATVKRRTSDSNIRGSLATRRTSDPAISIPDDAEFEADKEDVIRIPHRNTVTNVRKEYKLVGTKNPTQEI